MQSNVPGVVIDHIPADTQCYIGSPTIVILDDGTYIAAHDIFGPGSTYDTVRVFRSEDKGRTWQRISTVEGAFWSNLFTHRGDLYLMGAGRQFGDLVIRRSTDGGVHWTEPVDAASGLLRDDGGYHTAPMPMVEHNGRLWRAFEDLRPERRWGRDFRAFLMSAPVDADLLRRDAWRFTNAVPRDSSWLDGQFGGWLEGNAVITPEGEIVDILRVDYRRGPEEKAAIVRADANGTALTFNPADFIEFPGGCKKFTIRRDPDSGGYWTLANSVPDRFKTYEPERARNTLTLMHSDDLRQWDIRATILNHEDPETHGFQYVDWLFEGNDIIVASRTAFDDGLGGAHNQHDANFMTFHRIENFRTLRDPDEGPSA